MATATKKTAAPSDRARAVRPPSDRPRKRVPREVEDMPMPEIDVLDLRSEDLQAAPDMVEIFRLDGKPYYIDRNLGAGVSLRMLRTLRHEGENSAVAAMLEELLGDEAFNDLANFPGITTHHLAQILLSCQKAILGDDKTGPKA